jgi:L-asparaginase II
MLATCVVNGWTRHDYLDMGHPLQVAITQHVDSLIGTRVTHVGVDGCGAPTHAFSLRGLAVAYSTLARRGSAVATAMNAHPDLVGGTGRDISTWMAAVPGLMAKEGAAAVMAAALPDGRAVAFKIGDGSPDCRQAVTIEAMRQLLPSTDPAIWNSIVSSVSVPVLGHGSPVGMLRALAWQ